MVITHTPHNEPPGHISRAARTVTLLAVLMVGGSAPNAVTAQIRGLPVFVDATNVYGMRAGVDFGLDVRKNAQDAWGAVIGVARFIDTGTNCRQRLFLDGGGGVWTNPIGGADDRGVVAGLRASYMVNPCARPTTVPIIPVRIFIGFGVFDLPGNTDFNVPVGISGQYLLEIAAIKIALSAAGRVHFREPLIGNTGMNGDLGISFGALLGVGTFGGIRLGYDCSQNEQCYFGAGISKWTR